jgi:divalent metal cation (Fe/Co/Zn/Cd) transporter
VAAVPEVERLTDLLTMQLAPDEILINLDVEFLQGLLTDEIEKVIDRIEQAIRSAVPEASKIFIEVESGSGIVDRRRRL